MTVQPEAARARRAAPAAVCAWCGAAARPGTARLAHCARCGAASTHPAPSDDELQAAYADWYRPAAGRFAAGGDRLLRRSRAALARRLDRLAPPGPVLDVGCGDGVLLDALRERGRDALGLERVSNRPDVRALELTDFDERRGEWAAVVFWHSLEHLRQPGVALERAAALLAPDGVLVVAVPNFSSWQSRRFGTRWFARDIPRHLVHLPAATLIDGVRARGLRVERVSYWRGGQVLFGWLHGLVGALPGRLDLYGAIRRPAARSRQLTAAGTLGSLAAGVAVSPVALALSAAEIGARAGGTVYLEARRP